MHTTSTILLLKQSTQALGYYIRKFVQVVCSSSTTQELDREVESRKRQEAKKGKNSSGAAKICTFNLCTIKMHSLGDYTEYIELHGPTDGISTQVVSNLI
jgi:hypothetical protein